jgi:hypothetical protein
MILLDTNVLSEFMRPQPAPQVVAWLDGQATHALHVSAVSRAEIELGLALMPAGKRQSALASAAKGMFEEDFAGRCLPFDEVAATSLAGSFHLTHYCPAIFSNSGICEHSSAEGSGRLLNRRVSGVVSNRLRLRTWNMSCSDAWQARRFFTMATST